MIAKKSKNLHSVDLLVTWKKKFQHAKQFFYIDIILNINPFLLNLRLVGGNAVGIFIHSVDPDSAAYHASLRGADQILEYNGIDLRQATAEQAAYELAKPAEKVTLLVQYNPESKYFFDKVWYFYQLLPIWLPSGCFGHFLATLES